MRRERSEGALAPTTDNRPLTTDKQIENLLKEVVAKQDFLLRAIQELREQHLGIKSEMQSNYVATAAMFTEILSRVKA
jgi:hypothetical protein